jgi:iron-sulfur cluster assembly protein
VPAPTSKEVSALLAFTDTAVQAVKDIVSAAEQNSETGGLGLAAERVGAQANLHVSVVSLPAEDDEVIEEQGAHVFLEPEAASLLGQGSRRQRRAQSDRVHDRADQLEE